MTHVDLDKMKVGVSAISRKRLQEPERFSGRASGFEKGSAQRAIRNEIESIISKVGFNTSRVVKLLEEDRAKSRARFEKDAAALREYISATQTSFRQALQAQRQFLDALPSPLLSYVKGLYAPGFIVETPHTDLDIFRDSHIEAQNSWIKIHLDTNTRAGGNTAFNFYFVWSNDTGSPVVLSASTSLILNGVCGVSAAPGILSGHRNSLLMYADFALIRWSGWGTDPATGKSLDGTAAPDFQQTQYQSICNLVAEGGREIIFGGADDPPPQIFAMTPYSLSRNWLAVPAGAVTVFEVSVYLAFGLSDPEANISDRVTADFATNGYNISCPQVLLEISPTHSLPVLNR